MSSPDHRTRVVMALIAVGLLGAGWVVMRPGSGSVASRAAGSSAPATTPRGTDAQTSLAPSGPSGANVATPGSLPAAPQGSAASVSPDPSEASIGHVQPIVVDGQSSPQIRSVAEALQNHEHPERLSALIAPPPFSLEKFQASPEAYANEVVPGRAFQTAAPGAGVPVLRSLGPTSLTLRQDGETILRAKTTPFAPVTYTSFDLGRFGNQLTSQTVIADAHGVASVSFTPGPGTIDAVHILAGSPLATGQVSFQVFVTAASQPSGKGI